MKYRSTVNHALAFDLGGRRYDVPPEGECEIPSKLAYTVQGRGLPLEPIEGTEEEPREEREEASLEVWKQRAHNERRRADDLDARLERDAERSALEAHRASTDVFAAELRSRLGIGETASILGAIDALRGELATVTRERDELLEAPAGPAVEPVAPASPEPIPEGKSGRKPR